MTVGNLSPYPGRELLLEGKCCVCEISKLAPEGVPELVSEVSLVHLSAQTFVWFDETNIRYTALVWFLFLCYFSLRFSTHKTYLTDSCHQSQIKEEFIHHIGDCWCISSGQFPLLSTAKQYSRNTRSSEMQLKSTLWPHVPLHYWFPG